jgi:hypothetical protein
MYRGNIYKTNNAQGKTLLQLCDGDTAKMSAEQKRIEQELQDFQKRIYGDPAKKDSLDSIAKLDVKQYKVKKSRTGSSRRTKVSRRKSGGNTSSPGGSARVTVRRQRH